MNPLGVLRCFLLLAVSQQGAAKYLRSLVEKDPFCIDTTATFLLDGDDDPKDCSWLSQNRHAVEHLAVDDICDLHAISSLCRVTCGVCAETSVAVDLLKTCSDRPDPLSIPDMEAQVDCDWIRRNKKEYGNACELTKVALHCPSACGTFGLCVQERDENA